MSPTMVGLRRKVCHFNPPKQPETQPKTFFLLNQKGHFGQKGGSFAPNDPPTVRACCQSLYILLCKLYKEDCFITFKWIKLFYCLKLVWHSKTVGNLNSSLEHKKKMLNILVFLFFMLDILWELIINKSSF